MKHVLEALKLTQFRLTETDTLSRPALTVVDKVMREAERASEGGCDLKLEEEW